MEEILLEMISIAHKAIAALIKYPNVSSMVKQKNAAADIGKYQFLFKFCIDSEKLILFMITP